MEINDTVRRDYQVAKIAFFNDMSWTRTNATVFSFILLFKFILHLNKEKFNDNSYKEIPNYSVSALILSH